MCSLYGYKCSCEVMRELVFSGPSCHLFSAPAFLPTHAPSFGALRLRWRACVPDRPVGSRTELAPTVSSPPPASTPQGWLPSSHQSHPGFLLIVITVLILIGNCVWSFNVISSTSFLFFSSSWLQHDFFFEHKLQHDFGSHHWPCYILVKTNRIS